MRDSQNDQMGRYRGSEDDPRRSLNYEIGDNSNQLISEDAVLNFTQCLLDDSWDEEAGGN
jgi:hypothetical protein